MAQHDYDIANGTGATVRADMNSALAAVVTNNSGATEPSSRFAYMWWPDTTTGLLKIRNAANSAWVSVGTLATANLGLALAVGGTTQHALGAAGTPSYTFTGDTNTGFYSPGADRIGVALNGTLRSQWTAGGYFKANGTGSDRHEFTTDNTTAESLLVTNTNGSFTGNALQLFVTRNTTSKAFKAIDYYNTTAAASRFIVYDSGQILAKGSYDETTASAANVFIDTNGLITRATSSRIYKTDIRPIEDDEADAVLSLEPVRYRSLSENDNSKWSYYGLIAEDTAEVDPRLVHWGHREDDYEIIVTEEQSYNEETREVITKEVRKRQLKDGAELHPEGVQYERLSVMLISVVKRQQAAIEALEARVAALES